MGRTFLLPPKNTRQRLPISQMELGKDSGSRGSLRI